MFVFNVAPSASNPDQITDFSSIDDVIWLDDGAFVGLTLGNLGASVFGSGSVATTSTQRILVDVGTGVLYFDRDGAGGTAAVKFAMLAANTTVTVDDFVVI